MVAVFDHTHSALAVAAVLVAAAVLSPRSGASADRPGRGFAPARRSHLSVLSSRPREPPPLPCCCGISGFRPSSCSWRRRTRARRHALCAPRSPLGPLATRRLRGAPESARGARPSRRDHIRGVRRGQSASGERAPSTVSFSLRSCWGGWLAGISRRIRRAPDALLTTWLVPDLRRAPARPAPAGRGGRGRRGFREAARA